MQKTARWGVFAAVGAAVAVALLFVALQPEDSEREFARGTEESVPAPEVELATSEPARIAEPVELPTPAEEVRMVTLREVLGDGFEAFAAQAKQQGVELSPDQKIRPWEDVRHRVQLSQSTRDASYRDLLKLGKGGVVDHAWVARITGTSVEEAAPWELETALQVGIVWNDKILAKINEFYDRIEWDLKQAVAADTLNRSPFFHAQAAQPGVPVSFSSAGVIDGWTYSHQLGEHDIPELPRLLAEAKDLARQRNREMVRIMRGESQSPR